MLSLIHISVEAEKIVHIVQPVKDLFASIFFVSVGMMIDPAMMWEYAVPVSYTHLRYFLYQESCRTVKLVCTIILWTVFPIRLKAVSYTHLLREAPMSRQLVLVWQNMRLIGPHIPTVDNRITTSCYSAMPMLS